MGEHQPTAMPVLNDSERLGLERKSAVTSMAGVMARLRKQNWQSRAMRSSSAGERSCSR